MKSKAEKDSELERASLEIFDVIEKVENKKDIIFLLVIQMAHLLVCNYKKSARAEILLKFTQEVMHYIAKAEKELAALSDDELAALSSKENGHG